MYANERFLRLKQIIGDPKANPPIPPLLPIGKTAWWKGIAEGRFPQGIKLSKKITVWLYSEIMILLEKLSQQRIPRKYISLEYKSQQQALRNDENP